MSDFKVGDRVEYVSDINPRLCGWKGRIVSLGHAECGHEAHVRVTFEQDTRWVWESSIKAIPDEAPEAIIMSPAGWSDLLQRVEALECMASTDNTGLYEDIGRLQAALNDKQKQLAGVTEDCAMWKEKWEAERNELARAREEIEALNELLKSEIAHADRQERQARHAEEELATAKKVMHQQEEQLQRACELLKSIPQHMAIGYYDELYQWSRRRDRFIADNDATPRG